VADLAGSMFDSPKGPVGQFVHALGAVTAATGTTIAGAGAIAAAGGAPVAGVGATPGLGVMAVGGTVSIIGNVMMGIGGAISAFEVPEPGSEDQSAIGRALTGAAYGTIGRGATDAVINAFR